jgi:hypothetical protein
MNKEQVYDDEIAPLMSRIIETCKRVGISCLCSFDITVDPEDQMLCTTCLADENGAIPECIKKAQDELFRRPSFVAFTVTSKAAQSPTPPGRPAE